MTIDVASSAYKFVVLLNRKLDAGVALNAGGNPGDSIPI